LAKFNAESGVIEMEEEDEETFSVHFENARAAWKGRKDLQDGRFLYHVVEQGVWGRLMDRADWEYYWPPLVLEAEKRAV